MDSSWAEHATSEVTHTDGDPSFSSMPFKPHFPERSWASRDAENVECAGKQRSPLQPLEGEEGQEGVGTVEGALPAATTAGLPAYGDPRGAGIGKI